MQQEDRKDQLLGMLQEEPDDEFLNYALALEYLRSKEYPLAASQLMRVLQLNENYIAAYYQIGKLHEILNENDAALKMYHEGRARALAKKDRKSAGEFEEAIFLLED